MKVNFLPQTRLGEWSFRLIIAFFLLLIVFRFLVASGQRGGETFFSNLFLAMPMLLAWLGGVSAFFAGLLALIKSKERAVFVFLSTLMGFFILLFSLGEILFPH
ncbi:hypothetical protein FJZ41_02895 [Candidatus Shapirobacteria bacterium]|nr:hypothetical protein [Candidatus Shapirobacteria bacterium]